MTYDEYLNHLERTTGLTEDRIRQMKLKVVKCGYCGGEERCLGWTLEREDGVAWIYNQL